MTASDRSTILVVDDDERMRKLIARLVTEFGYTALVAADGTEAIHLYGANAASIAAATLDVEMPTTNGREVLAVLSEVAPFLPIVVVTGLELGKTDLVRRVPGTPGVKYVKKPFQAKELQDALAQAIKELARAKSE